LFGEFKHTTIGSETLTTEAYRKWLSAADVVVIAYNFDADTLRYVRYSMANKMPECLASGAVLLAIGPSEIATIDYLASTHAAVVINKESDAAVVDALKALKKDPDLRTRLSAAGHEVARTRHNIAALQEQLRGIFVQAVRPRAVEDAVAVPDARPDSAAQIELEQMRQSFAALSRYARDLDQRLGGGTTAPVPLAGGGDLIDQLKAAGPGSARLLLTSVGNAVLMQPDDAANRLEKDATLRAAILTALDALEDTDGHKRQYLRIRQRFVRGQGSEA
jgi:hypothetical protein